MPNKPSEEKLAKAAYNWLRISPILTIPTLLFVNGFDIAYSICENVIITCQSDYARQTSINLGLGVLVSACWHLLLLQYVNNKDSEFVRKHGKLALTYAGIRTVFAFLGIVADFLLGAEGNFACIIIIILFILWIALPNTGLEKIKKELEANPNVSREMIQGTEEVSYVIASSNEIIDISTTNSAT